MSGLRSWSVVVCHYLNFYLRRGERGGFRVGGHWGGPGRESRGRTSKGGVSGRPPEPESSTRRMVPPSVSVPVGVPEGLRTLPRSPSVHTPPPSVAEDKPEHISLGSPRVRTSLPSVHVVCGELDLLRVPRPFWVLRLKTVRTTGVGRGEEQDRDTGVRVRDRRCPVHRLPRGGRPDL